MLLSCFSIFFPIALLFVFTRFSDDDCLLNWPKIFCIYLLCYICVISDWLIPKGPRRRICRSRSGWRDFWERLTKNHTRKRFKYNSSAILKFGLYSGPVKMNKVIMSNSVNLSTIFSHIISLFHQLNSIILR